MEKNVGKRNGVAMKRFMHIMNLFAIYFFISVYLFPPYPFHFYYPLCFRLSLFLSLFIARKHAYRRTDKTGLKYLKIDVHVDIQTQTDFYVSRQIYRHRFTCGQTDVQTNSLTNKQTDTDRQNHTQADRRNNRHAKIKPYEQADKHRLSNLQAG